MKTSIGQATKFVTSRNMDSTVRSAANSAVSDFGPNP